MHMADALLAPTVALAMYAASGTAAGTSLYRLKADDEPQKLPMMAVSAALVFAGQMINYTIPGTGSSGHMCGGMLLSALLGPQAGFLSMIVILTIQCLFFADGGLMALGANIWNMAFYGCFAGYYLIWRPIVRSGLFGEGIQASRKRILLASVLGCVLTLQLGAFSVVLETSLSGVSDLPFGTFLALMQPIHLAVAWWKDSSPLRCSALYIPQGRSFCRMRRRRPKQRLWRHSLRGRRWYWHLWCRCCII